MNKLYEGKNREEAILKACADLDVARDELHFELAADEGKGLFRRVRIRVLSVKQKSPPPG